MANTVRVKYSNTAGNVPSSLVDGQIAIQQADGKLYYRASGGAVTALATGSSGSVSLPATITGSLAVGGDGSYGSVSLLLSGDDLTDRSPSPKTITNNGAAATGTAKFGSNSLSFSGSSSYLNVAGSEDFSLSGDFTLESWVYFNAAPSSFSGAYGACILATYPAGPSGSGGWQWRINGTSTSYTTINLYTGVTDLNWTGTFAINQWHHVAISRSGSSVRAFVDGVQVGATETCSDNMDSYSGSLWVGRLNANPYFFQLNGLLDDIRITKAARTIAMPTAALPSFAPYTLSSVTLGVSGSSGTADTSLHPFLLMGG